MNTISMSVYVCEQCGKESTNREEIELCEALHVGLSSAEEYRDWMRFRAFVRVATKSLSERIERDIKELDGLKRKAFMFEQKYGMKI